MISQGCRHSNLIPLSPSLLRFFPLSTQPTFPHKETKPASRFRRNRITDRLAVLLQTQGSCSSKALSIQVLLLQGGYSSSSNRTKRAGKEGQRERLGCRGKGMDRGIRAGGREERGKSKGGRGGVGSLSFPSLIFICAASDTAVPNDISRERFPEERKHV